MYMIQSLTKIPLGIYVTVCALVLGLYTDYRMLYLEQTADRALFSALGYPHILNILVVAFIILECYALYMILQRRRFGMYLIYAIYAANVTVTLFVGSLLALSSGNTLAKLLNNPALSGLGQGVSFAELVIHMTWYTFIYVVLGFILYSARKYFIHSPHRS